MLSTSLSDCTIHSGTKNKYIYIGLHAFSHLHICWYANIGVNSMWWLDMCFLPFILNDLKNPDLSFDLSECFSEQRGRRHGILASGSFQVLHKVKMYHMISYVSCYGPQLYTSRYPRSVPHLLPLRICTEYISDSAH